MRMNRRAAARRWLPAATGLLTWIVGGGAAALLLSGLPAPYGPWASLPAVLATGIGALVPFWRLGEEIAFVRRGYQVREVPRRLYLYRYPPGPRACVFEELSAEGEVRGLPFVRIVLGGGYPARSDIRVPSAANWDQVVPRWARGRRAEILARMSECLGGAGSGTRIVEAA